MSKFNVHQVHPLIENANTYILQKKYVSIYSQDRDQLKYPDPANFEIELPQDYTNVQTIKLSSWSFPANYSVFSYANGNVSMIFQMRFVYNPDDHGVTDPLVKAIYLALTENPDKEYLFQIEIGFYNPDQMARELTNKMNEAITNQIISFLQKNPEYSYLLEIFVEYTDFVIVYNSVSQILVFGNKNSGFYLPNDAEFYKIENLIRNGSCRIDIGELPSFSNWGLPSFLGFTRCPETALPAKNVSGYRFYYGDVSIPGDNGVWILPNLPGAKVWYLQAPIKINLMGGAYFFLEIDSGTSFNCIDETSPYNVSQYTITTNGTNGIVNAAFAKIAVPTTPISQWFDNDMTPYKWFDPPAERIRRLKIKIRYHNNALVNFGSFEYSFMLEFAMLTPQIQRKSSVYNFS